MPPQTLFADSFYWIALIFPRDSWDATVVASSRALTGVRLVTTDESLTEFLNHYAGLGRYWRQKAAAFMHEIRSGPQVEVLPQNGMDFDAALALYESRLDKGYSLTDCRSMLAMRQFGISQVLTNDHHFSQVEFTVLFP